MDVAIREMDQAIQKDKSYSKADYHFIREDSKYYERPKELRERDDYTPEEEKAVFDKKIMKAKTLTSEAVDVFENPAVHNDINKSLYNIGKTLYHAQKSDENAANNIVKEYKALKSAIKKVKEATKHQKGSDDIIVFADSTIKEAKRAMEETISLIKNHSELVINSAINTIDGINKTLSRIKVDKSAETVSSGYKRICQKENAHSVVTLKHDIYNLEKICAQKKKMLSQFKDLEKTLEMLELQKPGSAAAKSVEKIKEKLRLKMEDLESAVVGYNKMVNTFYKSHCIRIDEQLDKMAELKRTQQRSAPAASESLKHGETLMKDQKMIQGIKIVRNTDDVLAL